VDGLEVFDPNRMAGRILQQGDVVGLVEKAQQAFDEDEAKRIEKKVVKEGKFDLEDFLMMTRQLQKLGPLEGLLKLVPGVNSKLLKQANTDPKRVKHVEAIILSMTPQERRRPDILNGSRRARIAKGAGRPVREVNRLLEQFRQMQKMMKQLKGFGLGGLMGNG
jgi:signal recognition particle subunit SRP54